MNEFFSHCKLHIAGIDYVLPSEVQELLDKGACLVDLRTEFETEIRTFAVENLIYLPYEELPEQFGRLARDHPLILADAVGLNSKKAVEFLRMQGFEQLSSLAGGIADWEKDGFPMRKGKYQPLNGPCPCMIRAKKSDRVTE